MAIHIRRRECILTLGGAAAWPLDFVQHGVDIIVAEGTVATHAAKRATAKSDDWSAFV